MNLILIEGTKAKFENLENLNYQVSIDGEVWWYFTNSKWLITDSKDEYNSLEEIQTYLETFPTNGEEILLKAFEANSKDIDDIIITNSAPILTFKNQAKQLEDGSGIVTFKVEIEDPDQDNTGIKIDYAISPFTNWEKATIQLAIHQNGDTAINNTNSDFQVGKNLSLPTQSGKLPIIIFWDSKTDLDNFEGEVKLRLKPYDGLTWGQYLESISFTINNSELIGLDSLLITDVSQNGVQLKWDKIQANNLNNYELYYGENKSDVQNNKSQKVNLSDFEKNDFSLQGLKSNTTYYFKVLASDEQGNQKSSPIISSITFPSENLNDGQSDQETQTEQNSKEKPNENKEEEEIEGKEDEATEQQNQTMTNASEELHFTECQNNQFEDVAIDHWANNYIQKLRQLCLNNSNFVEGYENNQFKPDQAISRFEFLKLILLSNEVYLGSNYSVKQIFDDVLNDKSEIARVVYTAASLNIVSGYPDGKFHPNLPINRAEAAKILMTANGFKLDEINNLVFNDMPWYITYVYEVIKLGIMTGYEDGSFGADNPLLRSEAAKIAYTVLIRNGIIE